MIRKLMLAVTAAVLALPVLAHDDEFESDWGWIDDGQVEEYDFEGDVSVDMDQPGSSVSFDTFEEGLTPYGQWATVGTYGRVWRPAGVPTGWRPYYNGRWEWTDEGWLWISTEPWGWATYHYGRWAFDSFYGWVWVPGYQWAPAWVSWRFGVDYIGWAPLAPGLSVYVTNYPVFYDHWCFVPSARFVGVPVHSHAFIGHHRVAPLWSRTQPAPPRARVNGSVAPAWGGPARPFIEKRAGRPITPVRVQPVASPAAARAAPARAGVVPVYRPEAARASRSGTASRPGAITAPGRGGDSSSALAPRPGGASRSGAVAAPRSGATAEPRSGATAGPRSGATAGPSRSGGDGGQRAAPARPAPRSSGRSSSVAPPPPAPAPRAAPAPSAAPPRAAPPSSSGRQRSSRIESGDSSPSRGSSGTARAAPAPRGGSFGGGGSAASGGGAVSRGGGGRGGGSAHAAPSRN